MKANPKVETSKGSDYDDMIINVADAKEKRKPAVLMTDNGGSMTLQIHNTEPAIFCKMMAATFHMQPKMFTVFMDYLRQEGRDGNLENLEFVKEFTKDGNSVQYYSSSDRLQIKVKN